MLIVVSVKICCFVGEMEFKLAKVSSINEMMLGLDEE